MLARALSFGISGLEAYPVTIEADVSKGLPSFTIVGLPDNSIRESKERVRSAIRNSGLTFPQGRITVNLAPADTKKEGPAFDLAIALGILAASEQVPAEALWRYPVLGELSLGGAVKPVAGSFCASLAAANFPAGSLEALIVPEANAAESALAEKLQVLPIKNLSEAANFLQSRNNAPPFFTSSKESIKTTPSTSWLDFEDVKGQGHVKRGLEIAAAGEHNVLLIGAPGSGKTMLAQRFPGILPPMTRKESQEITRIHSILGLVQAAEGLISERPFRSPHHTASNISLVGGGTDPKPGEITLAHNGVLFLDELPEFSRGAIEGLRQPLEEHFVTVARASRTLRFPARFLLLAAMNPCPCGFLGDRTKPCRCSSTEVRRYFNRISGPLLDRIDIHLEVPALKSSELMNNTRAENSDSIRTRVIKTRERQTERFKDTPVVSNARMPSQMVKKHCALNKKCRALLMDAIEGLGLSARGHDKVLKVARTISDMAGCEEIRPEHLAEAIGYRCLDRTNA
jgi:magnesium chelatase family protein